MPSMVAMFLHFNVQWSFLHTLLVSALYSLSNLCSLGQCLHSSVAMSPHFNI